MTERIREKLQILADAAKYDVSCSSSGSNRKNKDSGLGNTGAGICHSYTEDGRCVSLLKILFSNVCIFDCSYCVSRRSNDVKRAAFTVQEVVDLTINFYRRNYIEGLFLSSGIFKSADYTMERMLQVVKKLRLEENFNGYIHLKTIPGASQEIIHEAGLYVDRMSINLEMPTAEGLKKFAPEKTHDEVQKDLGIIRDRLIQFKDERKIIKTVPKFVPAGQTTQMVVGAHNETDQDIILMADRHYKEFKLKRVYFSGYIPINDEEKALPSVGSAPPLLRENRLYQSDWLMRFYGFEATEIVNAKHPNLDLDIDPKLSWALRHPEQFPIDINQAEYRMILRVPGIGVRSAKKIVQARRFGKIHIDQIKKLGIAYNRAMHFIRCADTPPFLKDQLPSQIRQKILQTGHSKYTQQLSPQLDLLF
ncbi:putative DNA modification/repair radical SAM protein [Acinetobacter sp. RIT698]|jgi:putative DNA modification/repair radical SAM protein|uniref:Putative DNA modification/repair radical SAM protein n=1 Tax=Acinetobacter guillouiae TaxID=106649 RepID=A0A8X8KIA4_ACIGI|nr:MULTISPECIES: putative DNA modification/repair radical SAM protein [Acinetobacter]MCF0265932.1 putative DNA modification/repair radical SAM protein [Acinetobacter guillouiae]MDN5650446.1 putative DNA modification/repair radical SAM protein [Acinetobacter sp.]MRT39013.1 putative DNA modification/repair radical SAM protein [Acinetobacter sp. RIT698]QLD60563.1 putative DNA modification/repair radical SAM protein [Acinetobacter sp. MYb10]